MAMVPADADAAAKPPPDILGCVVAVFDARYLLAIAALAFAYSLAQALRHALRMRRGVDPVPTASGRLLDFASDQVVAYLLMSALSAATPITNRMRSAVINRFTDTTAAAISMAFLAFVCLALSAIVSGYKLSKQTYM
uniref:CASP-like protein n=1 Tax=Oryza barthii TaxID=65489 RepID=A0A0D3FHD6_9ORYZ